MPEAETASIVQAVALLADHRRQRGRLGPLPETCRPTTAEAGYHVQFALREHLCAAGHGTLAGYKIGATSQVMQDYLDIHTPCGGSMRTTGVQTSPARLPLDTVMPCARLGGAPPLGCDHHFMLF
jgi:2-keto-4-pentenoate hydratase